MGDCCLKLIFSTIMARISYIQCNYVHFVLDQHASVGFLWCLLTKTIVLVSWTHYLDSEPTSLFTDSIMHEADVPS